MFSHRHAWKLGEGRFEVVKFEGIWPVVFVWGSQNSENLENLVDFRVTHKEGFPLDHLSEDAPCWPQIDAKTVRLLPKQDFRTSVPKCDDFVRIGLNWETKGASEPKISQLNGSSVFVNQQILWFEISVEYAMLVEVDESLQDLVKETLGLLFGQRLISSRPHILLQIVLNIFKDQIQLVLRVDDLFQSAEKWQKGVRFKNIFELKRWRPYKTKGRRTRLC